MNFEYSVLRQHGLTVAFAAALLATACGGTFSGVGGAGAGGSGTGGPTAGAGGEPGGSRWRPSLQCGVPSDLVRPGPLTIKPGECCPTCEPRNGGAGGISSGGGAEHR